MRDVRLALRYLRKSPGYTLAVVLTLGAAIGANTANFSAVYGVLLKPLGISDPSKLVVCWDSDPSHNLPVIEVSYRQFEAWAAHLRHTDADAIGSPSWPDVLDDHGTLTRLASTGVSRSFFETFGVRPLLGRTFQAADDLPGAPKVVVISHGLWTRMFGANPAIVGATIKLDQPSTTVVGVMPDGFDFPRGTDLWSPVVPILADAGAGWRTDALEKVGVLFVVGRLRDGGSLKAMAGRSTFRRRLAHPNASARPSSRHRS
jgi:hypothetical protein